MPVTDQTPNVIIIDSTENLMEVSGGVAVAAGTKGLLFAGVQSDGSASYLLLDSGGRLTVTGTLTIPNTVTVTGSLKLSETATVTGSITVPNTVTVTGTISVTNVPTVTGSITVPNTVTITGSVGVNGQTFVSGGNLAVFISGSNLLTVTGSITVPNVVTVTGSLKLSEALPSGSNNIGGVGITSDPAEGLTGSAAPRTAMFVAGKDYTSGNLHSFHVRTSGTVPTGADNAVVVVVSPNQASIPVAVTGSVAVVATTFDAPNNGALPARVAVVGGFSGSNVEAMNMNNSGSLYVNEEEEKTYMVSVTGIAIGNNKSMLALFNSGTSGTILKIREVWVKNVQTSAVTGISTFFELFRFTGMSAVGTSVTPQAYDTNDTVASNITASTGGTVTGESASSYFRTMWSTEEISVPPGAGQGAEVAAQRTQPFWKRQDPKEKPIILRSNQGIHVKHTVNSTAGSFDITIVYTQV